MLWQPGNAPGGDRDPLGSALGIRTGLGMLSTLLEPRTVGSRRSTSPKHGKREEIHT